MATPIAHQGVTAGAKVMARTALELFARPALVDSAWAYFNDVQTKDAQYTAFLTDDPGKERGDEYFGAMIDVQRLIFPLGKRCTSYGPASTAYRGNYAYCR